MGEHHPKKELTKKYLEGAKASSFFMTKSLS